MKARPLKLVQESTLTQTILITLGLTALVGPGLIFPSLAFVLKEFMSTKRQKKYVKRALYSLEKQEMLSISESPSGEITIKLTGKGKNKVLKYNLDNMQIGKPKKWDGFWRVVIFDIPEKKKPSREAFRRNLQNLGFFKLQKSVFICPYPCKKEVDFLKHNFDVAENITYLIAKKIENENSLKSKFQL